MLQGVLEKFYLINDSTQLIHRAKWNLRTALGTWLILTHLTQNWLGKVKFEHHLFAVW